MEPTIKCGKHLALHTKLTGSRFEDVCLGDAEFDNVSLVRATFENVNMSGTRMHDINLSDLDLSAANLGGAKFKHIGPPPDKDGKQERQRPVTFEEMMLCDSTFRKVDMSNVRITECNTAGMTIDGIPVADMMTAYKQRKT